MKWLVLLAAMVTIVGSLGCKPDPLDSAAEPVKSTDKQPPAIPGKRPHRAPPLGGPNKGKDIFEGSSAGGA